MNALQRWLTNSILTATLLYIVLFWVMDWILGTERNRNILDYIALFVSAVAMFRYGPAAWRAFRERAQEPSAQLLIGNIIFWSGINAQSIWQLAFRAAERPDWMIGSPLNGFFKGWIVWGGIMCIRATISDPITLPPGRLFLIAVALFSGIIIGLAGARFLGLLV